jgi:hypothetical protein
LVRGGKRPDGRLKDIGRFKSELEANEWIVKHFRTWLIVTTAMVAV